MSERSVGNRDLTLVDQNFWYSCGCLQNFSCFFILLSLTELTLAQILVRSGVLNTRVVLGFPLI